MGKPTLRELPEPAATIYRLTEKLREDLAFAAPELWGLHIERRLAQAYEAALAALREDSQPARDGLDAAWAAVEEALAGRGYPSLHPHFGEAPDSEPVPLLGWRASVWADERFANSYADTPAAALRALAAKLVPPPAPLERPE